ncbi:MAG: hypothetical protein R3D29_10885 [Nitratireductor sp.]
MAKLVGAACGQTLNVQESAEALKTSSVFAIARIRSSASCNRMFWNISRPTNREMLKIQNAVKGVRIMFPLYNEEIHLLSSKDIASVRDLEGKKIAVGGRIRAPF